MSAPSAHPDSTNIDRLHAAANREKADLVAGSQPAPTWVIFVGMIVAIIAGGQLGVMTGGYKFETSNPFATAIASDPRPKAAGGDTGGDPFQVAMKKGAGGYAVCGGCHQGNGLGIAGQFPPLAGSEWVLGGTERFVRVVQHGLTGAITVKGANYNTPGGMQGFGAAMSAGDLANVLTYVRNSWGNEASMITKEMVESVRTKESARTTQWTASELTSFAEANVPGAIPAGPGATGEAPPPAK
jgi:mono/diheme cytochrome c family protein